MPENRPEYLSEAIEMIGSGYDHPSIEIRPPTTVIRRRGKEMTEEVIPSQVCISTAFKEELGDIDGTDLKVWLFIALSLNRYTERAFPGLRTIAKGCGIGINTARISIERLEKNGLVTVVKENRKVNIYEVNDYAFADLKTVSKTDTDLQTVSENAQTVSENAQTVSENAQTVSNPAALEIRNQLTINHSKPKFSKEQILLLSRNPDWLMAHKDDLDPEDFEEMARLAESEKVLDKVALAVEPLLHVTPNLAKPIWHKVCRQIAEREAKGQSLYDYAQWVKKNQFDAPKVAQIARDPDLIISTWTAAFPIEIEQLEFPTNVVDSKPEKICTPMPEDRKNAIFAKFNNRNDGSGQESRTSESNQLPLSGVVTKTD